MATILCPSKVDCGVAGDLGQDLPSANFSSELPDRDVDVGINFGFAWIFPPIGSNWQKSHCLGVCVSTVSQAEADICAALQELICTIDTWGTCPTCDDVNERNGTSGPPIIPVTSVPQNVFYNTDQFCTTFCPDGTPFTWGINAGVVAMPSQALANSIANSLACNLSVQNRFCLGSLSKTSTCYEEPYSATIIATKPVASWVLISGALPSGVAMHQGSPTTLVLGGIPTTPGNYTFTIRANLASGSFMNKTYTLHVLGFTVPLALPDGENGAFYTFTITAAGFVGSVTFTLESGTLPTNLILDPSGLLSGTLTEEGDFSPTIRITDSQGNLCIATFALHVNPGECPDWTAMTWTPPTLFGGNILDATFGPGAFFNIDISVPAFGNAFVADAVGTLNYTGPGCTCRGTITYTHQNAVEHGGAGFQVFQDATLILDWNIDTHPLGTFTENIDFVVAPAVASVITIRGRYFDFIRHYYSLATDGIVPPGIAKYFLTIINIP